MITALFSVLLLAADTPPATIPPSAETEKKAEKKICRTKLIDTGSRMRKSECKTQAEWDRRDQGVNVDELKTLGGR